MCVCVSQLALGKLRQILIVFSWKDLLERPVDQPPHKEPPQATCSTLQSATARCSRTTQSLTAALACRFTQSLVRTLERRRHQVGWSCSHSVSTGCATPGPAHPSRPAIVPLAEGEAINRWRHDSNGPGSPQTGDHQSFPCGDGSPGGRFAPEAHRGVRKRS